MTSPLSRRAILADLTVAGAAPLKAQTLPTNPDVVIIGAGSAGMAAGRALQKRGVSFVIVEAANRVGGRTWTERATFGAPVDHGCSWISDSNNNSFAQNGKAEGFTLVNHTNAGNDLFDIDGKPASDADLAAYDRAWGSITRALERAGKAGLDVPAPTVIPDMPWGASVQAWFGAMDFGVGYDMLSTADYWDSADSQPSFIVREGLGAVVATLADGLPTKLVTKVSAIDWSGKGVVVETSDGMIMAKACMITVSTGVLNAGSIRFTPDLPDWKLETVANIPMGLLIKVPMLFDGTRLGLGENNWGTYQAPEDKPGEACFFVDWPCGHDYLFGNIGGSFAWDLYAQGQDAVVDHALEQLTRCVGGDARKHFVKGFATDWADNPLTLGAYGAVRPGGWGARDKLAEPLADKLFFAGEAMAGSRSALVNGAFKSGQRTAKAVARAIT